MVTWIMSMMVVAMPVSEKKAKFYEQPHLVERSTFTDV